ncbi:MAG: cupin domain-containing protein [Gammaproteobacteria bacterium]
MTSQIISLSAAIEAELSRPAADRLLAGTPQQAVSNYFSDSSGQFHAGRWSSTRGTWRVRYSENELCVITAGKIVLTGEDGTVNSFGAGDAFVVPAGFSGTWQVLEDCTKIYAIFEKLT